MINYWVDCTIEMSSVICTLVMYETRSLYILWPFLISSFFPYRKSKANTRRGWRFREYASYSSTKWIGFTKKKCLTTVDFSFYIFIGIKNVNICTGVGRERLLLVTFGAGEDLICFSFSFLSYMHWNILQFYSI